jgi:replicative DNA helicase
MVLPAGNDDETIVKAVYNHIKTTGRRPLVIIDYIQILAPYDLHATDKQNTDKAVLELKRLSRAADIPIIGISSFNRDNYNEPVSMAAFKESGAIEYSSDVLIGLQYPYMEYKPGEGDAGRKSRIRASRAADIRRSRAGEPLDINLKILKNRNGAKDAINFVYHPWFNCYREKLGMPPINFEDLGEEIKQDDSLFS